MSNLGQGVGLKRHTWTLREEEELYTLGSRGLSFNEISRRLNVTLAACKAKYREIVTDLEATAMWTTEWDDTLVQLVETYGRKWPKIAKELKLLGMCASDKTIKGQYQALQRKRVSFDDLDLKEPIVWNDQWDEALMRLVKVYGCKWAKIVEELSKIGMEVSIKFVDKRFWKLIPEQKLISSLTLVVPENGQKDLPETPNQVPDLQDLLLPFLNVTSDGKKNEVFGCDAL